MAREPFQVLVLPYRSKGCGQFEYAVFKRSDDANWQGIAGGGEDNDSPLEAARRETWEESRIPVESNFVVLDTISSVPVTCFPDSYLWGENIFVIPEYSFGVDASGRQLVLSGEHSEYKWVDFEEAEKLLKYDSNKVALWELNQRLKRLEPRSDSA